MQSQHPPCPRCYSQEEVVRPWWGFKVIRNLWIAGMCLGILLIPLLAMDIVISMPMLMVYALAAGPVFGLAEQQPVCRNCGLGRPSPGWHETPVRPVPSDTQAPAAWSARGHVPERERPPDDEVSGLRPLPRAGAGDESERSS